MADAKRLRPNLHSQFSSFDFLLILAAIDYLFGDTHRIQPIQLTKAIETKVLFTSIFLRAM